MAAQNEAAELERTLRRRGHDVRVTEPERNHFDVRIQSYWPLWLSWLWRPFRKER